MTKKTKKIFGILAPKMIPIDIAEDGSIVAQNSFKTFDLELRTFYERLQNSYDLKVIIQRDCCWKAETKADLIKSIMSGHPIGFVTICDKPMNVSLKNVLDAKNRATTITEFYEGKFSITINLYKDGKIVTRQMTWPQIVESKDPQLQNLKESFLSYKIQICEFTGVSMEGQSDIVWRLNQNVPMTNEELLYTNNFWAKGFLLFCFDIVFEKLIKHTCSTQVQTNARCKGIVFLHRIMYTCFGPQLKDAWAVRDLGNSKPTLTAKPFVRDTRALNKYLAALLTEKQLGDLDAEFVKTSPFWEEIRQLKRCCDKLAFILTLENPTNKHMLKNDLFDCVVFFMKKLRENRLTFAMMDSSPKLYADIIKSYVKAKGADPTMTGQSVVVAMLLRRMELFEKVWKEHVKDDGFKDSRPSAYDKSLAYLESSKYCPITNEELDENAQVGHNLPASKYSESEYTLMSEKGNRLMGNNTLDETASVLKFQTECQKKS